MRSENRLGCFKRKLIWVLFYKYFLNMNKYKNRFRKCVKWLIGICITWIVIGIIFMLCPCDCISWQDSIKDIIVPMFCALVWASIPLALDNSLSNEKLKIVLERLKWRWKNRYKDEKWKRADWTKTELYDKEYKFITKNRWESDNKIKEQMGKDEYWDKKFSRDAKQMNISKDEALNSWIEDHVIY